mgnify:CR=1 FL=1
MEVIVAAGAAEQEFDKFIDAMDLDVDPATMDAEDKTAFDKLKRRVVRAIGRGALIFNDSGEAVYTPYHKNSKRKEPITFHERSGADLIAMDKTKKGATVSQTYAIMGAMCKEPPSVFAGLVGPDIKVCEALFALLMD